MRHSAELGRATVSDVTISKQGAFLYLIYGVLESRATLYVGQTRRQTGALGRLAEHLSDAHRWNTYLQRVADTDPDEEVALDRVDFVAVRFASRKEFRDSREYREAVEALVQLNLLNWIHKQKLEIAVVSHTRTNAYSKLPDIQEEADRISEALEPWILECCE